MSQNTGNNECMSPRFDRYDFTSGSSSDVAGLAYLKSLCTDRSVSVVEDRFDFSVLTAAAHELGHG